MTKITNELLEDYAMNYYSIMRCIKVKSKKYLVSPLMAVTIFKGEIEYIQLRSIESITDEEAVKIAKIEGNESSVENRILGHAILMTLNTIPVKTSTIDYIRSIGIATPFRGITVYELVESGKLKLI